MTKEQALEEVRKMKIWGDEFEVRESKIFDWIREANPDWSEHWVFSAAFTIKYCLENDKSGLYRELLVMRNKKQ